MVTALAHADGDFLRLCFPQRQLIVITGGQSGILSPAAVLAAVGEAGKRLTTAHRLTGEGFDIYLIVLHIGGGRGETGQFGHGGIKPAVTRAIGVTAVPGLAEVRPAADKPGGGEVALALVVHHLMLTVRAGAGLALRSGHGAGGVIHQRSAGAV